MLIKIIRQPLLHFLLLGGLFFLLHGYVNMDRPAAEGEREIRVDKERLLTYLQYRTKKFNPISAEQMLAELPEGQLQLVIDAMVREEVLYREALALKLDKDDYVIRRRLTQKLEFITKGFMDAASHPTEAQVTDYFAKNKVDYFVSPYITFTHTFFSAEERGWGEAEVAAKEQLKVLRQNNVPFADAVKYGDRFLYHLNYVERVPEYVESHFGADTAQRLFALPEDEILWQGPYRSAYGYHLIMMSDRSEGRYPELSEIYDRVQEDARNYLIKENVEQAIGKLVDNYKVEILYDRAAADSVAKVTSKEVQ